MYDSLNLVVLKKVNNNIATGKMLNCGLCTSLANCSLLNNAQ